MTSTVVLDPFVRVHIWEHPSIIKEGLQKYAPGHAALEIFHKESSRPNTYISFWPPLHTCCANSNDHFHDNYDVDYRAEGKKDSWRIDLYVGEENIAKIEEAFEKFKAQPYQWTIHGSSSFGLSYERNCAGLSLFLLEKGGLNAWGGTTDLLRRVFAISLSSLILGGIAFYTFKRIQPLIKSLTELEDFYQGYLKSGILAKQSLITLARVFPKALTLQATLQENAPSAILSSSQNITAELRESVLSLDSRLKENICLLKEMNQDLAKMKNQFDLAALTLLVPIGLGATLTFLNQRIWIKTITPFDVKIVAQQANLSLEKKKKNSNRPHPITILTASIGIGVLLSISNYYFKYLPKI